MKKPGRISRSMMGKNLDCLAQTVSRNMDVRNSTMEGSEVSEEHSRPNLNFLREY